MHAFFMSRSTFKWCTFCSFCVILLRYLLPLENLTGNKANSHSTELVAIARSKNLSSNDVEFELPLLSGNITLIGEYSLTAILPVTTNSLPSLRHILQSIVHQGFVSVHLREILFVAQAHIMPDLRSNLFTIMSQMEFPRYIQCSIRSWEYTSSETEALIFAAGTSSTKWLLILDEHGLSRLDSSTQKTLLGPPATSLPLGPRGVRLYHTATCIHATKSPQRASYLIPPFVMPFSLTDCSREHAKSWAAFGSYLSGLTVLRPQVGGIVLPQPSQTEPDMSWCTLNEWPVNQQHVPEVLHSSESMSSKWASELLTGPLDDSPVVFGILFLTIDELRSFAPVACSLEQSGHTLHVVLYELGGGRLLPNGTGVFEGPLCTLSYDLALPFNEYPVAWLNKMDKKPEVIITLSEMADSLDECSSASVIRIPRLDLKYCAWMSSLTSHEWRSEGPLLIHGPSLLIPADWNVPQVTLSIITKDRPQSLSRLLGSISDARFYGDQVDIRVNLEQSSDLETMDMVKNLKWDHGSIFIHHRVIHGGLLAAVAESWFPHSNDSYGVLLEDDVEVSPYFYAWIKMTLLRYRYGSSRGKARQMFGISLYQPKNLELDVAGRRSFNASHALDSIGAHATSPYLSQVPCSWGAVYFPEHWMEFHEYLTMRFSESVFNLTQIVVPNVRSNQWTRSWKKYFIELVYLRGYVMLYPNFSQYVSLSTNHLEVGSHVKIRSKEKQESFLVPLMKLQDSDSEHEVDLLDLPDRSLPDWTRLPVLNLTGAPTTLDALFASGVSRYAELGLCEGVRWTSRDSERCLDGI